MRRLIGLDSLRTFRASGARTAAVAAAIIAAALLIALSLDPASDRSTADHGPLSVRGNVYDQIGSPVAGANVTVSIIHLGNPLTTLWYDSTESTGFYTVFFGPSDWYDGDTIEVTAKYGLDQAINSTLASDSVPNPTVDVHIGNLVIPEFGASVHLPLAFVSMISIALFLLLRRKLLE